VSSSITSRTKYITAAQTARNCGCSIALVKNALHRAGVAKHPFASKFFDKVEPARQLYSTGLGLKSVSRQLGITVIALRRMVSVRSIPVTPRLQGEALQMAITLYHQPLGLNAVARIVGVSTYVLRRILKAQGIKLRGYTVGVPKRQALIQKITAMKATGNTRNEIAKTLGYSVTYIGRLVRSTESNPRRPPQGARWAMLRQKAVDHYRTHEHMSINQTARDLGCNIKLIRDALRKAGAALHPTPRTNHLASRHSDKRERAIQLYNVEGRSLRFVAQQLEIDRRTVARMVAVRSRAEARQLIPNRHKAKDASHLPQGESLKMAVELYHKPMSLKSVARMVGTTPYRLGEHLKAEGVELRRATPDGPAKMALTQVITTMSAAGKSDLEIAAELGYSRRYIGQLMPALRGESLKTAIDLYLKPLSLTKVAPMVGTTIYLLRLGLKSAGIKIRL